MEHELDDVEVMMLCTPTKKPDPTANNETDNHGSQSSTMTTFASTVSNTTTTV